MNRALKIQVFEEFCGPGISLSVPFCLETLTNVSLDKKGKIPMECALTSYKD